MVETAVETKKKSKKDLIPGHLKKGHQAIKLAEQAYLRRQNEWHEALARYRAMCNTTIPGFERILLASKIAQEADNKAFIKMMLGR
jgi:hypothetical protein